MASPVRPSVERISVPWEGILECAHGGLMVGIMRIAVLGAVLAAAPAWAQVYKWVDEQGRTHYGEKPPASKAAPVDLRDSTGGPARREVRQEPVVPPVGSNLPKETDLQRQEREFQ